MLFIFLLLFCCLESAIVKTRSGSTFTTTLIQSESILDVKRRLHVLSSVPVDQQRLIWNGQQLSDSKQVSEYTDLDNESILYLTLRLRGGK